MATKPKEDLVEREVRIEDLNDMMDVNVEIMSEVVNDAKLTASEKMRTFSQGVRNQAILSRDQQQRISMLAKLGVKANGLTKSLSFQPAGE